MPLTVLLIQTDTVAARAVLEALASASDGEFNVEWEKLCSGGLQRLSDRGAGAVADGHAIKAVLLDLALEDCAGIETFERVFARAPHIPLLILSRADNELVARLAVQRGAQDYLPMAGLDNYLLPRTLLGMIRNAANVDALFDEKERAQITLNSISDAVMSIDVEGGVTFLNAVAETLTGWSREEAAGHPVEEVFRIVDAVSRAPVPNPLALAMRENRAVALTPNCMLIRRDGKESDIEDSAAPIHDRHGLIKGAVMVFHDSTVARTLSVRMAYLANHDGLTDLPNRLLLADRLREAIAMAQRYRRKLAVLFLDVDRFKYINDSLGHPTGDRLLRAMAQRLRSCVRESDTVSRAGGDEFVILLPEVAYAQDAAVTAEKILLATRDAFDVSNTKLRVTTSIGIATYPDDGSDGDTLLKNADAALYHAKDCGRDQYQFFSSDMNDRVVERQSLEAELRHALDRQEFVLNYQPKMDLGINRITGVEALIRWHHPQRGLILPSQFMGTAEETALIVPIGRWVLGEACRQVRSWHDCGRPPITVAVNVSAVELRAKGFVASVRAILAETGLESKYLELELTETFLLQNPQATAAVLEELNGMGVKIALDDFGTGYSSLSYLRKFPIDTLKIDRSFVSNLASKSQDASIVGAMISLGRSLHMQVVAEGVETLEQLAFLRTRNCPEAQGYYFSPAVSAAQFARLQEGNFGRVALD